MWKLVPFAVAVIVIGGCSGDFPGDCENTILSEAGSPNGRLNAVLFERYCGATTGLSTQVSVLRSGIRPDVSGNAFVADTNNGAAGGSLSGDGG